MKTLIIGQAPSRTSDPGEPLSGKSGERLARLCGISLSQFICRFDRENLLPAWPGERAGEGDSFIPVREARELAQRFRRAVSGRRVVVLGATLCCGFDLTQRAFEFAPHWEGEFAWSPHPSGVSRWWNDPENARRAGEFWRELARSAASPRP